MQVGRTSLILILYLPIFSPSIAMQVHLSFETSKEDKLTF